MARYGAMKGKSTAAVLRDKEARLKRRRELSAEKRARAAAMEAAAEAKLKPQDLGIDVRHSTTPLTHRTAKENITKAFELMGGVAALVIWGKKNRTEFYRMWSRLIPREAPEEKDTTSLETLLAMLAARGDQPVAIAAFEIGVETMTKAKIEAEAEDAAAALAALEDGGTLQ